LVAVPLLRKEPEIYPEELFALPKAVEWRVAHVRSRQEKMLARYLLERRVPYFLPQTSRTVVVDGRKRTSFIPLFSGYVFFRGDRSTRDLTVRSNLTVCLIDVPDQALLQDELQQIRRLQVAGASLVPLEEFLPGESVRIGEGAFAGYAGTVTRSGRAERLVVQISLLRKTIAVEFERSVLKRPRKL
jgi:transcription antitermination factor NusG